MTLKPAVSSAISSFPRTGSWQSSFPAAMSRAPSLSWRRGLISLRASTYPIPAESRVPKMKKPQNSTGLASQPRKGSRRAEVTNSAWTSPFSPRATAIRECAPGVSSVQSGSGMKTVEAPFPISSKALRGMWKRLSEAEE